MCNAWHKWPDRCTEPGSLKGKTMKLWKRQLGSTSVEQMMVISVITIGATAASYVYVPTFQQGTSALANDVSVILTTHDIGGITAAGNQTGGGSAPVDPT